ncbi:MAG: MBL fold metallo-hydrolase [Rhodospirillales bacterium]|nr:MBL fold metallo-hydrolase [Rhodospirillales bacterium]MCB9996786.1 MBL fold metallo-hydrolase [Rhodospirillales bacterium]
MKLTFMGATGTVTGSKYLLEDGNLKVMVDCGLFQGLKPLRQRNWEKLPVNPAELDAVLLTHAHIDHSGYLPLLVKDGFKGKIYCTAASFDLCSILLPDCGRIQQSDADRANRYGYTKHHPALPLYTEDDAYAALEQFKTIHVGQEYELDEFLRFNFSRAGHILGASCITVTDGQTKLVFSGDLGRPDDPVMKAPAQIQEADYLVLESTYGDRLHEEGDPMGKLADIINRTAKRGGITIIPSFAVGRAQLVLYYIHELLRTRAIPNIPVYLDSPMAIDATKTWQDHHQEHRLDAKKCGEVCRTARYVQTVEESKMLDNGAVPAIIISASGMATGGRVLHHMAHYIGDGRNTILFAGYQAAGTRGERLVRGEKEIKIHGQMYRVEAEIDNLASLSAHADYSEIIDWLRGFREAPRRVFLTHGEPEAAAAFKTKIEQELNWAVDIPEYLQQEEL